MGTETPPFLYEFEYPKLSPVKLNDPLMGTETLLSTRIVHKISSRIVKLNDPLMGTETNV